MQKILTILRSFFAPAETMTMVGRVKWRKFKAGTRELLAESEWKENLIMFGSYTGKDIILKQMLGDTTQPLAILWADIGTSSTAPAITDTQLGAAVARVLNPVLTQISNVASFQFFWPDANLTNGTYNEIGCGTGGTSSINTGNLFNHALFATPYVKGSNEDTEVQIDFTQA